MSSISIRVCCLTVALLAFSTEPGAHHTGANGATSQFSTLTINIDSLDYYVNESEATLIRAFKHWAYVERNLLRHYATIYIDNAEIYRYLHYRMMSSDCMHIQIGGVADSILHGELEESVTRQVLAHKADSIFAIPDYARAWEELSIVCPYVMESARKLLDSIVAEPYTLAISFCPAFLYGGGVTPSGDSRQAHLVLAGYEELYLQADQRQKWTGTKELAITNRVVQLFRCGQAELLCVSPIADRHGNVMGDITFHIAQGSVALHP